MAEGSNLDLVLTTDYLSVDDQKILNMGGPMIFF